MENNSAKKDPVGIQNLHDEIIRCRICEDQVDGYEKPPSLDRGQPGSVMVIGQGPGRAELGGTRAFAGQSGRTLDVWLQSCGADPADPRRGIYFTSVIKCVSSKDNCFARMAQNCAPFLARQILEIHPHLIVTLGKRAYEALRIIEEDYEAALCNPRYSADVVLVTPFGFHFSLLHWPHPSGLNRWLNTAENQARHRQSFEFVRKFLGGDK